MARIYRMRLVVLPVLMMFCQQTKSETCKDQDLCKFFDEKLCESSDTIRSSCRAMCGECGERVICKRDLKNLEIGRRCSESCKKDDRCGNEFQTCQCDDYCGKSCIDTNIRCRLLSVPSNGFLYSKGREYGQIATYRCKSGYIIVGPSSRRCRSDGKWSGNDPLCIPFGACGFRENEEENMVKVVHGAAAQKGDWPWQVLMIKSAQYFVGQLYKKSVFGGGSVIDKEWVLSAAHIFKDKFPKNVETNTWKNSFLLVFGMTAYVKQGHEIPEHVQIFEPKDVFLHPKSNSNSLDYDVALIHIGRKLKRGNNDKFVVDDGAPSGKVIFNEFTRPVCLPCMKGGILNKVDVWRKFDKNKCFQKDTSALPSFADAGDSVVVTGFGTISPTADGKRNNLREGMLTILHPRLCAKGILRLRGMSKHANLMQGTFCATYQKSNGVSCQSDGGGPVLKEETKLLPTHRITYWVQIGIAGWASDCSSAYNVYYVSIPSIMDWVWKTFDDAIKSKVCPVLSNLDNGSLRITGRKYGHKVTYECDSGYTLIGSSERICRSDSKWSGDGPICVPFSACGLREETRAFRKVVGGSNARPGAWPWQANFFHFGTLTERDLFGSGSLINEAWILSAAHNFVNFFHYETVSRQWNGTFIITLGMMIRPKRPADTPKHVQIFEPKMIYFHPKYNITNFDFDVALIKIGKKRKLDEAHRNRFIVDENSPGGKATFTHFVRPICLPCVKNSASSPVDIWKNFDAWQCDKKGKSVLSSIAPVGSDVVVTGLGLTKYGDYESFANILQEGHLKIIGDLECARTAKIIKAANPGVKAKYTDNMLCALGGRQSAKIDACIGDAGSPLMRKQTKILQNKSAEYWIQVGIVSWGHKCGIHHGFYTSVSSVMQWIWQTLDISINGGTPCVSSPCDHNAVCKNINEDEYVCSCKAGYTGSGKDCKKILPCDSNQCHEYAKCFDIDVNNYVCECKTGYKGDGKTCKKNTPCDLNPCHENAKCLTLGNMGYLCECLKGYRRNGKVCTKILPCDSNPCDENAYCQNRRGNHVLCTCKIGYEGDGKFCEKILPCDSKPCAQNAVCRNIGDESYHCACKKGYAGDGKVCKKIFCPDIEDVLYGGYRTSSVAPYTVDTVANFTCDQGFNAIGKFSLTCQRDGRWSASFPYCVAKTCKRNLKRVEKDRSCRKPCKKNSECKGAFKRCECDDWCGKSCFNPNADCPRLPLPKNGYIIDNGRSYGRAVTYGCDDGYLLNGSAKRTCRSDRKWSGQPPFCVPFSACGQPGEVTGNPHGKVRGGSNARQGAWPWQALLVEYSRPTVKEILDIQSVIGGGSVINDEWILSAAHVIDHSYELNTLTKKWDKTFLIILGMTSYPSPNTPIPEHFQVFQPRNVHLHPKFDPSNFDYDIALIHVGKIVHTGGTNKLTVATDSSRTKISFTRFVRPVCLPCMNANPGNHVDVLRNYAKEDCARQGKSVISPSTSRTVMVTGFGKTAYNSSFLPTTLQQGEIKINGGSTCSKSLENIRYYVKHARYTDRMFCATSANKSLNVDACTGDSGGPVVMKMKSRQNLEYWMQIGIVSWGYKCGENLPGFYSKVHYFMDWIWKILDTEKKAMLCDEKFFRDDSHYNATSCPSGMSVGSKCQIRCEEGYKWKIGKNVWTAVCSLKKPTDSAAEWDFENAPTCKI